MQHTAYIKIQHLHICYSPIFHTKKLEYMKMYRILNMLALQIAGMNHFSKLSDSEVQIFSFQTKHIN